MLETDFLIYVDDKNENRIIHPYHEFTIHSEDKDDAMYNSHEYVEIFVKKHFKPMIDAIKPSNFDMQWSRNLFLWEMQAYITYENCYGNQEEFYELLFVYLVNRIDVINYSSSFEFLYHNHAQFKKLYEAYVDSKNNDSSNEQIPLYSYSSRAVTDAYLKARTDKENA